MVRVVWHPVEVYGGLCAWIYRDRPVKRAALKRNLTVGDEHHVVNVAAVVVVVDVVVLGVTPLEGKGPVFGSGVCDSSPIGISSDLTAI